MGSIAEIFIVPHYNTYKPNVVIRGARERSTPSRVKSSVNAVNAHSLDPMI
jgi:hypothetical protein